MRILVTFAVEAEFSPWRKLRRFTKAQGLNGAARIGIPWYSSALGEHKFDVLLTGIGKASCEHALHHGGAANTDLVISSGLAGALKIDLRPGDVVVPRTMRTLRNDASVTADTEFRERAVKQGALAIETLITVEKVVQSAEEKARLAFFGEAVDMESAIVASHFAATSVPVVTIRAISDAAGEDLPIDFDRCLTPQGAVKPMSLVNAIVRRPGRLPNLVRFGRQSNQAAQRLARAHPAQSRR